MRPDDLETVDLIGAAAHPEFPERPEVAAERLALFPAGCLCLGAGLGYAIAVPTRPGSPPALDALLLELPADADCLHLHDVALIPEARGRGFGRALVAGLERIARDHGFRRLSLIAVHDTGAYWRGHGFAPAAVDPAPLATYGAAAEYLTRPAGD